MITRLSVVLSPRMSLQMFLQPLVSAGDYGAIKEVAAPRTFDFVRYGEDAGSTITAGPGGQGLLIDPDGAGAASPFAIAQPDFNVRVAARQYRLPLGVPPRLGVLLRLDTAAPRCGRAPAPSTSRATAAGSSALRPTTCFSSRCRTGSAHGSRGYRLQAQVRQRRETSR